MNRSRTRHGFTLIELLVVIAIIGVLAAVLVGGLGGGSDSVKLQAAQASIANLITVARSKAISRGLRTRLVFHADMRTGHNPERFLNYILLQQLPEPKSDWRDDDWMTVSTHSLPEGIYVLPYDLSQYPGIVPDEVSLKTEWTYNADDSRVMSSKLFQTSSRLGLEIDAHGTNSTSYYQGIMLTERGTLSKLDGSGSFLKNTRPDVLVVSGSKSEPSVIADGQSPVVFTNANLLRAVLVSKYGVPVIINNREDIQ